MSVFSPNLSRDTLGFWRHLHMVRDGIGVGLVIGCLVLSGVLYIPPLWDGHGISVFYISLFFFILLFFYQACWGRALGSKVCILAFYFIQGCGGRLFLPKDEDETYRYSPYMNEMKQAEAVADTLRFIGIELALLLHHDCA